MAPPPTQTPSRPPITSRIRSSFEKRRRNSNELQSPNYTNGNSPFVTQDPESLRKAIDEAINSETFQNAIAANLAKLIKPSIKSALDTIQPVVEAVYNHEVLLRKTNHSVENILERLEVNADAHAHQRESVVEPFDKEVGDAPAAHAAPETRAVEEKEIAPPVEDAPPPIPERAVRTPSPSRDFAQFRRLLDESNARTATALSELSSSVAASNGRIAEALHGISNIQAALGQTKENVDGLKVFSEQSTTTATVMQAQLDQLQADIGQVIDVIGADLGKNVQALHEKAATWDSSILSSHTTKLDVLATDLGALKGHSDTMDKIEAISTELIGLKGSVEAGISSNTAYFTSLDSEITNVLNTIEGHTNTLGEIKDKGADPKILAALQQSNDSHATHTAALGEIKEMSLSAAPAPVPVLDGGNVEATVALQDLKADLASLKENIAAGLTANNEKVTGLSTKIDSVLLTVEAHKASDANHEILAAVQQSNESHASHSVAPEELKLRSAEPAPPAESCNLVALEAKVGSIASVLDTQTAALEELKTASNTHAVGLGEIKALSDAPAHIDNSALESQLSALNATLDTHSSALEEIKSASSSHAAALDEVKSLSGAPSPIDSTALESHIAALATILDTHSKTLDVLKSTGGSHSAALDEIKAASASHATSLEEVKSLNPAPGPADIDFSGLESQIAALSATLETHSAALDEIRSTGGLHSASLDEIKSMRTSHAAALESAGSLGSEPAPAADVDHLAALEAQIGVIVAILASHTSALDELKSEHGSHNAAVISALDSHTSALDEIKGTTTSHATALEQARSMGETLQADNSNLAALEAQVAAIVATLEAHTAVLDYIKVSSASKSTEVVPASNNEALEGHISTIVETLGAHTNLLNEIKDDVSAEILTTLHELGQSQAQHGDMLAEVREADVSDEILTLLHANGESHAGHGTTLGQIQEGIQALSESHAAHGAALDDIKSRSVESAPTAEGSTNGALEAKIDGIASTLESHKAALSSIQESHASHAEVLEEIRDATAICNESHADHALAFSEIKEISSASNEAHSSHIAVLADIKEATMASNEAHASHTDALAELKAIQPTTAPDVSRSESPDIAGLETQLNSIISALERQTATLSSLMDSSSDKSVLEATLESHDLLTSHTTILNTIKDNSSHDDILSNLTDLKALVKESKTGIDEHSNLVRDLRSDTKETHSSLTSAIAGLTLGGAAGAGTGALVEHESDKSTAEILTEVKAVKEKVDLVVSQLEINHTTITTSITTLSDELKAEIDATGTQITESITTMDANLKEIDFKPITSSVKQTGQVVKDLSSQIDNLESHIQDNTSKVNEIHQSVHLNDTGISQLREYAGTREVVGEAVPEGMWFGSGSGSPSAKRLPHPFEHSSPPAAVEEPEHEQQEEREGLVLEAIPEVDTPLEESPVRDEFETESREPAMPEEGVVPAEDEVLHEDETAHFEPEVSDAMQEDESIEVPREYTHEVVDDPTAEGAESRHEDFHEAVHDPISHDAEPEPEHEVEPKTEAVEEGREFPAELGPEHVEESKEEIPVPYIAKPEELKEDEPAPEISHAEDDIPVCQAEEVAEETVPDTHQKDDADDAVPVPQREEHEHMQKDAPIDQSVPLEPEVHDAPVLSEEPLEAEVPQEHVQSEEPTEPKAHHEHIASDEPTEPEIHDKPATTDEATEPEVRHEHGASEKVAEPAPELAEQPTKPEVHHQAVDLDEPVEPAPESEVAHEVSEPEPVLEHHEQEPEAEPIEEPTEVAPEHESAHEVPEIEHIVEHHEAEPEPELEQVVEQHEPEPEPEPASEPTETISEPETAQELPEAEPLEEHDAAPAPAHLHEAVGQPDRPPTSHTEPEPHQVDPEEEDLECATESASTSAIVSPMTQSFTEVEGAGAGGEEKSGKKEKGKKVKNKEKAPFVMDGEEPKE